MKKIEYIIVQAGGKGTRLQHLTENKPKALVSVNNSPLLFHLFNKFPDSRFVIITDYKHDVIKQYLQTYAKVNYVIVHSKGTGNVCGLKEAGNFIPHNKACLLLWCDLLLSPEFNVPAFDNDTDCFIGITDKFQCSWSYNNGNMQKRQSSDDGIVGCNLLKDGSILRDCPTEGSFLKWVIDKKLKHKSFNVNLIGEIGSLESFNKINSVDNRCRPYNQMIFSEDEVIKKGLTPDAVKLIDREVTWYKEMSSAGFSGIPKIKSFNPLTMQRIHGTNIFQAKLNEQEKKSVLLNLVATVKEMHKLKHTDADGFDILKEYYFKTMDRLHSIRELIPFSNDNVIRINGKICNNVLVNSDFLYQIVTSHLMDTVFAPIHGDCTLTNTMVDDNKNIYFIDARGYFGSKTVIGDVRYDWAKLYYSIAGNFDQFNIGNFSLHVKENEVTYSIGDGGWSQFEDILLSSLPENCDLREIKLIHSIIWLSLASHCSDNYDALCTAFYNGSYLLQSVYEEYNV